MHLPLEFIAINICMHFFQYNLALYTIYDNRYTVYGIRSIYIYESILYICVYVRTIFANKQKHETITRQDIQVQVTKNLEIPLRVENREESSIHHFWGNS